MRQVIISLCLIISANCLIGANIHVPSDQPSIQAGIDAAANGDTVLVAPGTYLEHIDFHAKGVTVLAEAGPLFTYIQGFYNGRVIRFTSGEDSTAILDGFSIHSNGASLGIISDGSAPIIQNCDINSFYTSNDGSGLYLVNSGAKVRYNYIHSNYAGLTGGGICVLGFHPIDTLKIYGNTICTNAAPHGAGIGCIAPTAKVQIYRNLIYGNSGGGYGAGIYYNGVSCDIHNNTIYGNTKGIEILGGANVDIRNNVIVSNLELGLSAGPASVDYNDVWNNGSMNEPGPNGISMDPLFDVDFTLMAESPCIDAGDPDPNYNDQDGTRNDMGAFFHWHESMAPNLYPIGPKTVAEADTLLFSVMATDPNGTIVGLTANPLPRGADFVDSGSGRGAFLWIPDHTQAGVYSVMFTAIDDSAYTDYEVVAITVTNTNRPPSSFDLYFPFPFYTSQIYDFPLRFLWGQSIDPDSSDLICYRLQVAIDSNFMFVATYDNIYATEYEVFNLSYGTHYWWRVEASDTGGYITPCNEIADFMTWILGDVNHDNSVNTGDAIYLVNAIFKGGQPPNPIKTGDINGDCQTNVADAVYLIGYIFRDGPRPKVGCTQPATFKKE